MLRNASYSLVTEINYVDLCKVSSIFFFEFTETCIETITLSLCFLFWSG